MRKVLEKLGDEPNRRAHFRTVIALILNGEISYFEGNINGVISTQPRGDSGFGYDPIFVPEGFSKSFAELSADKKNQISHRALAVSKLVNFLISNPNK